VVLLWPLGEMIERVKRPSEGVPGSVLGGVTGGVLSSELPGVIKVGGMLGGSGKGGGAGGFVTSMVAMSPVALPHELVDVTCIVCDPAATDACTAKLLVWSAVVSATSVLSIERVTWLLAVAVPVKSTVPAVTVSLEVGKVMTGVTGGWQT